MANGSGAITEHIGRSDVERQGLCECGFIMPSIGVHDVISYLNHFFLGTAPPRDNHCCQAEGESPVNSLLAACLILADASQDFGFVTQVRNLVTKSSGRETQTSCSYSSSTRGTHPFLTGEDLLLKSFADG